MCTIQILPSQGGEAATLLVRQLLGNSKVGAEIRSTCLLVRDLLETTVSGDLDPVIRRRLAEVVQLVQSYCRLAELEIAAGERPKVGDVGLPEGTGQRSSQWAEGEETRTTDREELAGELGQAMWANGRDPTPMREVLGG